MYISLFCYHFHDKNILYQQNKANWRDIKQFVQTFPQFKKQKMDFIEPFRSLIQTLTSKSLTNWLRMASDSTCRQIARQKI